MKMTGMENSVGSDDGVGRVGKDREWLRVEDGKWL